MNGPHTRQHQNHHTTNKMGLSKPMTFIYRSPINQITNPSQPTKPRDIEIRVCTNRTCKRQGSLQTLDTLSGLAPAHVTVNPCGCLGRCGSGPNLVALPGPLMVGHCGTPASAARFMAELCGVGDEDDVARRSLESLALRKRGESELERGDFTAAEALFSQVIEAKPIGGIHVAYKERSAVRLALGNLCGALEDANDSIRLYPLYTEAYICQGDAFLAMNQLEAAEDSYRKVLEISPSVRRSKSFKDRVEKLQEKLTPTATS